MSSVSHLSRRTVLRGLGAAVALPWLEAMGPVASWGAEQRRAATAPNRLAFLYVPNGVNMEDWTPSNEGALEKLPKILGELDAFKSDFNVLTGLTADKARPHGDGGGDHARALSAFLTGAQPRKTDGADIRAGVSVDQVAATRIGDQTRLASLEIGCDASNMAGNCDSGYSCVYNSTMSWRSATQPLPKEPNPKLIFERLFGGAGDSDRARRDSLRKSILDFVREDSASLAKQLGANDRRKLDEYFTSIRDIEERIARAAKLPEAKKPDMKQPAGIPKEYEEHCRLLADLLVLAFQTDVTRVCTFVLANEGSNRAYPFAGVPEGHHDLSHHGNDPKKKGKIAEINRFHARQLGYLLGKLQGVKEGNGTLLDHCLLAYGSGNSDGDRHNHDNLPILLCGRGGGTVKTGRHIRYTNETPVNNLWLSMLERIDVRVPFLGDSTGALQGLAG